MTEVVNGKDLMLFKDGKSFALATSCKLSLSVETVETSSKDSSGKWKTSKPKKLSWNVSTENLFAVTSDEGHSFNDVFKVAVGDSNVSEIVFTTANENQDTVPVSGWTPKPNTGYKGKVIITQLDINSPNNENATYSASFEGTGPLEEVPVL